MSPRAVHARNLDQNLQRYSETKRSLPGVDDAKRRAALVNQLIDSSKRTRFVEVVSGRPISPARLDPASDLFDPIRGAIACVRSGDVEEASWLVFLATHFGKSSHSGWQLARAIHGRLGRGPTCTWRRISADPEEFKRWFAGNNARLLDHVPRLSFSNHRKYESLRLDAGRNTPAVIRSYVAWVVGAGSHRALFADALNATGMDSRQAFDRLYRAMPVLSFGRLAKFDYLSMIGKVMVAPIIAGSTYLKGATGPLAGARLLFGPASTLASVQSVDEWLVEMGDEIGVGMQDLEDALCNWQKEPSRYQRFVG